MHAFQTAMQKLHAGPVANAGRNNRRGCQIQLQGDVQATDPRTGNADASRRLENWPIQREGTRKGREKVNMALRSYRSEMLVALLFLIIQILGGMVVLLHPPRAAAQGQLAAPKETDGSPALLIGFVGGLVHRDDRRHAEVQIAQQIQATYGNGVHVQIFENRRGAKAHKLILDWLDSDADGKLTDKEKRGTHVILFGHSWGASTVVSLARELQRNGIPVSLTIQVDSITKNGEDDSVIPANVAEAVNFYQTGGILHGRSRIRAADPSRTRILGNFRFAYKKEPAECGAYPWYDRLLFKGHTAIECDPRVWSQIDALIRMRLPPVVPPGQSQVATRTGN